MAGVPRRREIWTDCDVGRTPCDHGGDHLQVKERGQEQPLTSQPSEGPNPTRPHLDFGLPASRMETTPFCCLSRLGVALCSSRQRKLILTGTRAILTSLTQGCCRRGSAKGPVGQPSPAPVHTVCLEKPQSPGPARSGRSVAVENYPGRWAASLNTAHSVSPAPFKTPSVNCEGKKACLYLGPAPLDTTAQEPEPRQTQWLIEQGSPSACSPHTAPEPWDPQKHMDGHPWPGCRQKPLRSPGPH